MTFDQGHSYEKGHTHFLPLFSRRAMARLYFTPLSLSSDGGHFWPLMHVLLYINGPDHMTKMAAMPIYGKNHTKYSSLEPVDQFQTNLLCGSIGDSGPS